MVPLVLRVAGHLALMMGGHEVLKLVVLGIHNVNSLMLLRVISVCPKAIGGCCSHHSLELAHVAAVPLLSAFIGIHYVHHLYGTGLSFSIVRSESLYFIFNGLYRFTISVS